MENHSMVGFKIRFIFRFKAKESASLPAPKHKTNRGWL